MAGENETPNAPEAPPQVVDETPSAPEAPSGDEGEGGYFVRLRSRTVTRPLTEEDLTQVSRHYAIKGVLFTLVGVVAILFPLVFGLAVEQLLAWILVLGGGITLVQFLTLCCSPGSCWELLPFLLLGMLHFAVGLWLLLKPIQGLVALTLVLTAWFLVHGFLKLIMACQLRRVSTWPAVLISGIISIALGVTIVVLTPRYGLELLGIVFGADLLSTGVAMLLISCMACCGRGPPSELDAEAAREPLLQDNGHPAAPSA